MSLCPGCVATSQASGLVVWLTLCPVLPTADTMACGCGQGWTGILGLHSWVCGSGPGFLRVSSGRGSPGSSAACLVSRQHAGILAYVTESRALPQTCRAESLSHHAADRPSVREVEQVMQVHPQDGSEAVFRSHVTSLSFTHAARSGAGGTEGRLRLRVSPAVPTCRESLSPWGQCSSCGRAPGWGTAFTLTQRVS